MQQWQHRGNNKKPNVVHSPKHTRITRTIQIKDKTEHLNLQILIIIIIINTWYCCLFIYLSKGVGRRLFELGSKAIRQRLSDGPVTQ